MADIDNGTLAIIVISVALGVTLIILLICLIVFCRLRLQDDTNIRKRVLARHHTEGYVGQSEVKVTDILEEEVPIPMPVPMPQAMPLPRREIYREPPTPPPPPPPPPSQPEIIVHEVVHRYQPTQPTVILSPPTAPPMPELPPQRIVRRSSWSAPQENDEWVMIKKTKKKKGRRSRDNDSDDSEDSDEEEVYTRKRHGYARGLAHYDLAVPMPMGGMVMGARPMMAAPMMMAPMAPAVAGMPMMTTAATTFQPTYGAILPMM
jgi:hypothetical protein